ncbi:MAG: hypothetical protein Q4F72_11275 [Desulfovibrionaceae bacterium]|nr:hypothetical protein [Desulfovibrionaceae bacterium]
MKVIHKKNGGLYTTRNVGMEAATISGMRAALVTRPRDPASTLYQQRPSMTAPSMAPSPTKRKSLAKTFRR